MENYSKGSRESFQETIKQLRIRAEQGGVILTDEEIAENLGIPAEKFREYYNDDNAPKELFTLLREKYRHIIGSSSFHHIWVTDVKEVDDPDPDSPDEEEQ